MEEEAGRVDEMTVNTKIRNKTEKWWDSVHSQRENKKRNGKIDGETLEYGSSTRKKGEDMPNEHQVGVKQQQNVGYAQEAYRGFQTNRGREER